MTSPRRDESIVESTPLLPLHLSLAGRRVVVVGGGTVAARKACSALAAAATVTVVAPETDRVLSALAGAGGLRWVRREFRRRDLRGAWLVYAATGVESVDSAVSAAAEHRRLFCVRADRGVMGSARSAAVVRRDGVIFGVSSELGVDPRRVMEVRDALGAAIDSGALKVAGVRRPPAGSDQLV